MANEIEVVISGVGGYFPKGENLEKLKQTLLANEILLETRWTEGERGVSNKIGKCPSIERFDTAFFGIHRQQCSFMDPMQRLMLERTFEALLDAGVNPQELRGKKIGCFMGSSIGENDNLFYESIVSGFGVTGHSRAMMANRVSYWLNLKGPSCAYDSNWINGIEMIQLAFEAIRDGHCEAAIIGTANLALNSEISWLYNDMGLLSSDGSTKAFDAEASGYARSDGVVAMYIQRATNAKRSYATIVGTATKFNGFRNGPLLDLDQSSMISFLEEFYDKCKVRPQEVDYVECYGCAIKKTDEVELNSIDAVYCKNREKPLMIGSVIPNTGHSEASANLFSIAKVIVAMETGKIPATLQHSKANPNISGLTEGRLEIITKNRDWDGQYAAINGIGISSSYAHCLLKANTKKKQVVEDNLPRLVVVSARTEIGITNVLETIKNQNHFDEEYLGLIQEVFSKSINNHLYRGYAILDRNGEINREFEHHPGNKRQTWFVFSGMGSQWIGMGTELMQLPIFAETIMKCHHALQPHGLDLLNIITDSDPHIFDNILHSFVGIAAIQIALTDILTALGVTPDGIIGHSVGELGCAYADHCLTTEEMIMCAYYRGKASLEATLIKGMMAAIGLGYNDVKNQCPKSIEVACHNSASSSTISGPTEDMEIFVKELQNKGIFARLVNVSNIAYHSRYIKPAAPLLLQYLQDFITEPVERSSKWISTSVPESEWGSSLAKTTSAEYLTNNLLSSVLFEEGSKHIPKDSVVIEIAPHGLLQAILRKSLKPGCTNIALTQRGNKTPVTFLLNAIGKMHLAGLDVNVTKIFPKIEFPVSRGTCGLAPLVDWEHSDVWRSGAEDKLNFLTTVKDTHISLNNDDFKHCEGHKINNRIVFCLSSYLTTIIKILSLSKSQDITNVIFENVRFKDLIHLRQGCNVPFFVSVQKGTGEFEVMSEGATIATGRISIPQAGDDFFYKTHEIKVDDGFEYSSKDFYREFLHRGHQYCEMFQRIKAVILSEEGSIATISGNQNWQTYLEAMLEQFLFKSGEKYQEAQIPSVIQRINLSIPDLPKFCEDICSTHNYSTGVVHINGLQLCGVTTTPYKKTSNPVSFDSYNLLELDNCVYENIDAVLNICINLTISNFPDVTHNIAVIEVVTDRPSLMQNIKNVTSKYSKMQATISTVTGTNIQITTKADPVLVVINDELHEDVAKAVITGEVFALVQNSKALLSHTQIVTVAEFTVQNRRYSLVRKLCNNTIKLLSAKNEPLTAIDILKGSHPSSIDLKEHLENLQSNESLYLVCKQLPSEGIATFVNDLRKNFSYKVLKYLFLLDDKVPQGTTIGTFCKNALSKGNVATIMKNCITYTYVSTSMDLNKDANLNNQLFSKALEDCTLSCIGVNRNDETLHSKSVEAGNIDYSAVTKNGRRIMGVARFDTDTNSLILDEILKWNVPDSWSIEDACTVPHAYMTAYYCLVQKAKIMPGETVLIDSGCSSVGLAAISIASSIGCTVYATVATDWQRSHLKKNFYALRDKSILSSEDSSFEAQLLNATNGLGAQVIVSCQTASLIQCSLRCLAEYGRYVQLGKLDNTTSNLMGMSIFLNNTCVIGAVPENIFSADEKVKQKLHDLMQEGIERYAVRPLYRKVVENLDVGSILRDLGKTGHVGKIIVRLPKDVLLNQLNMENANQFICDASSLHLICGLEWNLVMDVAEWLVFRGARKIVVIAESNPKQLTNRRISLLRSNFNVDVMFVSKNLESKDDAVELISSLISSGPIHGIYVLPENEATDSHTQSVGYIEDALRTISPKALFVNFLRSMIGVCQNRKDAGFPTFNVEWDESLRFDDVLSCLDDVLSFRASHILIKNDQINDADQETWQSLYKRLLLLLPTSAKELVEQMKSSVKEPELVQLPSLGPRHIREVPPVIIVPGLSGQDVMKDFAMKLLYPTFCTKMGDSFKTLEELSKIFAEKIRKLFPSGPYNVIGISSGGILAIEITKILQSYANTQVTLIDGAPDAIQASLKYLGEGPHSEVNLLIRILDINNTEHAKSLISLPSWEARLTAAVEKCHSNEFEKPLLKECISLLKKNLDSIAKYSPSEELLPCAVYLIRPAGSSKLDYCGLNKYFRQNPEVCVTNGDHLSILKSEQAVDLINTEVTVI